MNNNVDASEIAKFSALASRWWDPLGPQQPLHVLNPVRLAYVQQFSSIKSAQVLDIGCGAGLLTEAMAAQGALATGIDLSPELIDVAQLHGLESGINANYRVLSAEALASEMPAAFDVITCMEMLEHVPDPQAIVQACFDALKPGGKLFVSTLNRTPAAFALAIVGAEYVARLLPKGTHDYRRFIKPSEIAAALRTVGFVLRDVRGLAYNPLNKSAVLSRNTHVNYILFAEKPNA